jgi:hypothetical protein
MITFTKGMITKDCEFCSTSFSNYPSSLQRFCSSRCSQDNRVKLSLLRTEKSCTACFKSFPLSEDFWHLSKKNIWSSSCRTCACTRAAEYYVNNREEVLDKKQEFNHTPEGSFKRHGYHAASREIPFLLTFVEFMTFWQKPCHYCSSPMVAAGLDRIDSSKGYYLSNVVSCCSTCNYMKSDMSTTEFLAQCLKIVAKAQLAIGC